jgi:hypothetical protein
LKRSTQLKQGKPLQRRTPMNRVGKLATKSTGLLAKAKRQSEESRLPKVTRLRKPTRPKMTPIRRAARGQDCTLTIPGVCNRDPASTVLCHSNSLADGKGMGLKAPDTEACFGCSSCHDVLDGRRPRPAWLSHEGLLATFRHARMLTHAILRQKGLIE